MHGGANPLSDLMMNASNLIIGCLLTGRHERSCVLRRLGMRQSQLITPQSTEKCLQLDGNNARIN